MFRRDTIFYAACGLVVIGVVLASLQYELGLLFFVVAYLLRPALHEFGFARQYADERQLTIHSRSGNIAFIVTMLALVGYALLRAAQGKTGNELYEIIFIGLSARALTGLVMVGDFRKAGIIIISAIGVFLSIFIILEGGFSLISLAAVGLGLLIIGIGQLARKYPRIIASLLIVAAVSVVVFARLYQFHRVDTALWLFFVAPLVTSSLCLFLGSGTLAETISVRARSIMFGSLGAGVALVFAFLILFGGKEEPPGETRVLSKGVVAEIQGIPCEGGVTYSKDGKLQSCILARDDTLSGQVVPAGSEVAFSPAGILDYCALPRDTYIQGHLCKGEGPGNWATCFYPTGRLKLIWLGHDEVIQGIPCKEASFWVDAFGGGASTAFYENGRLKRCKLADDVTIEGRQFKKGKHINLDQEGHPMASQ